MKKAWIPVILLIILILVGLYLFWNSKKANLLPLYFKYTISEKNELINLQSKQRITNSSFRKWDDLMFDLIKENKIGDAPASRIYAYVYVAQRDAAFLSYNVKHQFMGNLDMVSAEVLCVFFPNNCPEIKLQMKKDVYSTQLAKLVLNKIKGRLDIDKQKTHPSTQLMGKGYWQGVKPYYGLEVGSWQTWIIASPNQFRPPKPFAPDHQSWLGQLKQTEAALNHITPEQTKAVVSWSGNPSTITPPGMWLIFANDYMLTTQLPLSKILFIRSILAMGIADAVISIFDAKYTYWIARPYMLNPNIHTIMPTPNHPSYPAAHSGISATAATILSFYFPENKKDWWQKAHEASESRIWGGIHFPIDAQEGLIFGTKVGNAIKTAHPQWNFE
ncbi:MAG: vanadium-dependent haloperoxidase [Legionella sp.]|nr:vanadium-dependent haloperoxidase [Legionella sp.]